MEEKMPENYIFNEETRKAIEDARRGIGLSKAYNSVEELFAALNAEDDDEEEEAQTSETSLRGVLSQYANPDLTGQEKTAWERAATEKYS